MRSKALWMALMLAPIGVLCAQGAYAAGTTKCTMHFTMKGWSAIYQTANGTGTVTCENGQSMDVVIDAKGGGLSFGKYQLDNGVGHFSGVTDITDILGSYATANAHGGIVHSSHAAAMTKGPVSLALTATGKGWDFGAGFESFSISRPK